MNCYIIGKGLSLKYLTSDMIGEGITDTTYIKQHTRLFKLLKDIDHEWIIPE